MKRLDYKSHVELDECAGPGNLPVAVKPTEEEIAAALETMNAPLRDKRFIYAHSMLFPNGGKIWPKPGEPPSSIDCEYAFLIAYNVRIVADTSLLSRIMEASTWEFQIEGHGDQWYHTHYGWSLVDYNDENDAALDLIVDLRARMDKLQAAVSKTFRRITSLEPKKESK